MATRSAPQNPQAKTNLLILLAVVEFCLLAGLAWAFWVLAQENDFSAPEPEEAITVLPAHTLPPAPTTTLSLAPASTPTPTLTAIPTLTETPTPTATDPPAPTPTEPTPLPAILAAGDVAVCEPGMTAQTAGLLRHLPGEILVLGDASNNHGSTEQYANCFHPTWGQYLNRMYVVPGNHDYESGGDPFYSYFGAAAGPPGLGYFSFDLHGWHIIGLNTVCGQVDRCSESTEQYQWLINDLAAHPSQCSLVFWHNPYFSPLPTGGAENLEPFFRAIHAAGADIVLNGHDHVYVRYAPMDPEGNIDPENGVREFIVGTGGAYLQTNFVSLPAEEMRISTWGLLQLELGEGFYRWSFFDLEMQVLDSGEDWCH
ncbi:MAG TPA: metallophosphoesterase [Anaerolineaceae bacterium]|nr:metallophosphoesterase [Anaerolineaceae bacterium]